VSAGYIGSDRPYLDGEHEMELRCVGLFPYQSLKGPGNCFHFTDPHGRLVVCFSRRNNKIQVGSIVYAKFVIYAHREFVGQPQNIAKKFRIVEGPGQRIPNRN
jgi:hypothetical protein